MAKIIITIVIMINTIRSGGLDQNKLTFLFVIYIKYILLEIRLLYQQFGYQ